MRNVIISLAFILGCSDGSGFVASPDAGTPGTLTGLTRGRQVETGGQGGNTQPRASQDAQAPDSRVVEADALVFQSDTMPTTFDATPTPPPVAWEPGPETTDPALMACPPTKGNSLGIGKACSNDVGGTRCPSGLTCLCGGSTMSPAPLVPKTMPCMCTAHVQGDVISNRTCPPCGDGAGCCTLQSGRDVQWVCLPNSCAGMYCRFDSKGR